MPAASVADAPSIVDLYERMKQGGTQLGPETDWPDEIDTLMRNALQSDFPISYVWGAHRIQTYNSAYIPIYGDKHPQSFGAPIAATWHQAGEFLGPAIDQVINERKTLTFTDMLVPMDVAGSGPEECYLDFSYSPVISRSGAVLGLMSVAYQKTRDVVFRRRSNLSELLGVNDVTPLSITAKLRQLLLDNPMDCVAAAFYAVDQVNGALGAIEWTIGLDADQAEHMRPYVYASVSRGGPTLIDQRVIGNEASPRGCAIPLYHLDGARYGALLLVPNRLVPVATSLMDYARAIASQFHAALHAVESQDDRQGRVTRSLEEHSLLYGFVFQNIADGAIVSEVGEDEVAIAVNARACAMLGYSKAEILGLSRDKLFLTGDTMADAAARTRAASGAFVGDLVFRHKSGRGIRVEASSSLVETPHGNRAVTIMRDISHREAAERAMSERSRREAITNLTGGIAHDFNNLLTVISGSVEVIIGELDPDFPYIEAAQNALLAANRASGLTSQLLSYSRQQALSPRLIDIVAFIEELGGLLRASLTEVNQYTARASGEQVWCAVDETHLTTALINLATNARDSMPSGGIFSVTTSVATSSDLGAGSDGYSLATGDYAVIAASDTGCGMTAITLEHVFELFYTTKDVGRGTGLGLAMVQGFARQSGGDVRIQSELGAGTCVYLILPLAKRIDAAPKPIQVPANPQTIRVLCVEDNELVLAQAKMLLQKLGIEVLFAGSGPSALAVLDRCDGIDLLFTDMIMPGGMTGLDLARALRLTTPDLPVILTTGKDAAEIAVLAQTENFVVLPKPYNFQRLEHAIRQAMSLT